MGWTGMSRICTAVSGAEWGKLTSTMMHSCSWPGGMRSMPRSLRVSGNNDNDSNTYRQKMRWRICLGDVSVFSRPGRM